MLARRLPGVLPAMTADESLEVTRIHSVAGLLGAFRTGGDAPLPQPSSSCLPRWPDRRGERTRPARGG
jgi:predicted ATPase with chaperone activity